ncbi:MAG: HAMP domain-containing protein [Mycobacterium sp.]|nr:HAMP domain-containing protein [Mycobacterium sp.]
MSAPNPQPRPRRRLLSRVGIQSKLLLMILTMSVLAALAAGGIGFQSGRSSLRAAVFDRLTGIRELQSQTIEGRFTDMRNSVLNTAANETTISAIGAFTTGFDRLANTTVTPAQAGALDAYYTSRFAGASDGGGTVDVKALMPASNAQKYLQAEYTVASTDPIAGRGLDDAGDGSAWSAANARYNAYFRRLVERTGYADLLLLDNKGDVVYTANKGVDLGTSIITGPYRGESTLADAYRRAMSTNDVDSVETTDFARYLPVDEPTAWIVTPIGQVGRPTGVLAMQFPLSMLNRVMTFDRDWTRVGMGQTGETFLIGPDDRMRSDSRLFLEDPDAYRKAVIAAGTPAAVADQAIRIGTTVLIQPVGTSASKAAQRGDAGTDIITDYLGRRALLAYAPVKLAGLQWVIVSTADSAEAFAPESRFAQRLARTTAGIIFIACLVSALWSRVFIRPIRRLEDGARRISAGDYNIAMPVESRDEFGQLTGAFNEMSRNLAVKDQLLTEQRAENERLLRSLMPDTVVQRYRDGEETIAEEHQNVSVLSADVVGLDDLSGELDAEETLAIINNLASEFDRAAEDLGVERVRNTYSGYLASCGLAIPRLDNAARTVDFALEMQRIVERYNAENDQRIALRVVINTGAVTSGLVGRASLVYDMWGSTVNLAAAIRRSTAKPGVYVASGVHEVTGDTRRYVPAGSVTIGGREEPVWLLVEDDT